jgi:hypothetical protein
MKNSLELEHGRRCPGGDREGLITEEDRRAEIRRDTLLQSISF